MVQGLTASSTSHIQHFEGTMLKVWQEAFFLCFRDAFSPTSGLKLSIHSLSNLGIWHSAIMTKQVPLNKALAL